jgi:hypothetical protein
VTPESTAGERKVIRWVFGAAFVVAVAYIAWAWIDGTRECTAACLATGFGGGALELTGGNRLELRSRCECVRDTDD